MGRGADVAAFNVEVSTAWKALSDEERQHWETLAAARNVPGEAPPEDEAVDLDAEERLARE